MVATKDLQQLTRVEFQDGLSVFYGKRLFARTILANKNLFAGTLPANKNLFAGTLPANKNLFAGTVPANKNLFAGTVPANKNFYKGPGKQSYTPLTEKLTLRTVIFFGQRTHFWGKKDRLSLL